MTKSWERDPCLCGGMLKNRIVFLLSATMTVMQILIAAFEIEASDNFKNVILYPTNANPLIMDESGILEVHVSLVLPLTPPPGVQQSTAVKGWKVRLINREGVFSLTGEQSSLVYEQNVMRIRPLAGNTYNRVLIKDIYRIFVKMPSWIPSGTYGLELEGPGFMETSHGAVVIQSANSASCEIEKLSFKSDARSISIKNFATVPSRCNINLKLTKEEQGIIAKINNSQVRPEKIALAKLPDDDSRVLSFAVEIPPAVDDIPGISIIKWSEVSSVKCNTQIYITEQESRDAVNYRELSVKADPIPHTVIWDFGDGYLGFGDKVKHRFMLSNIAKIFVKTFDDNGSICVKHTFLKTVDLSNSGGCSCNFIGR